MCHSQYSLPCMENSWVIVAAIANISLGGGRGNIPWMLSTSVRQKVLTVGPLAFLIYQWHGENRGGEKDRVFAASPSVQKWKGEACGGANVTAGKIRRHLTDRDTAANPSRYRFEKTHKSDTWTRIMCCGFFRRWRTREKEWGAQIEQRRGYTGSKQRRKGGSTYADTKQKGNWLCIRGGPTRSPRYNQRRSACLGVTAADHGGSTFLPATVFSSKIFRPRLVRFAISPQESFALRMQSRKTLHRPMCGRGHPTKLGSVSIG